MSTLQYVEQPTELAQRLTAEGKAPDVLFTTVAGKKALFPFMLPRPTAEVMASAAFELAADVERRGPLKQQAHECRIVADDVPLVIGEELNSFGIRTNKSTVTAQKLADNGQGTGYTVYVRWLSRNCRVTMKLRNCGIVAGTANELTEELKALCVAIAHALSCGYFVEIPSAFTGYSLNKSFSPHQPSASFPFVLRTVQDYDPHTGEPPSVSAYLASMHLYEYYLLNNQM